MKCHMTLTRRCATKKKNNTKKHRKKAAHLSLFRHTSVCTSIAGFSFCIPGGKRNIVCDFSMKWKHGDGDNPVHSGSNDNQKDSHRRRGKVGMHDLLGYENN